MAVLEVRRHSIRKRSGGSQLSQPGVDLARSIGATIGPFETVVASVVPRARETAIAMGFAVDQEFVTLSADPDFWADVEQHPWYLSADPWAALAELVGSGGAFAQHAHATAAVWRDLLTPLSKDQSVLVIGHSGELEAALIACFPGADHSSWGPMFGPCEGARLVFDGEPAHFSRIEIIRAEASAAGM